MEKKVLMKLHGRGTEIVMALCDMDLLGRTLEDGDIVFKVTEGFYGGDPVSPDVILRSFNMVRSVNAVGRDCVSILDEAGLVDEGSIRSIAGTPHVQIYSVIP